MAKRKKKDEMNDPERWFWIAYDYRTVYSYDEYLACFPADKRPADKRVKQLTRIDDVEEM
jgi:hypothetical protein